MTRRQLISYTYSEEFSADVSIEEDDNMYYVDYVDCMKMIYFNELIGEVRNVKKSVVS